MHEINKTRFRRNLKVATLGSRRTLCVNEKVTKLTSVAMMNERCLDLRQKRAVRSKNASGLAASKEKVRGCQFLEKKATQMFREAAVENVLDIEEHAELGKKLHSCPYYGVQHVSKDADVVCMPYNLL